MLAFNAHFKLLMLILYFIAAVIDSFPSFCSDENIVDFPLKIIYCIVYIGISTLISWIAVYFYVQRLLKDLRTDRRIQSRGG